MNGMVYLTNDIAILEDDDCICRFVKEAKILAHDHRTLSLITENINIGDVIVDVGAFIGDHTIYYSDIVNNEGLVYAFEPNPRAFECLKHNLKHRKNVVAYQCGLGSESNETGLVEVQDNIGMSFLSGAGETPIIRLDDLELERCNLIKIDVEGYELEVLRGATNTIRILRPILVIELNKYSSERMGFTYQDIFDFLEENNYTYRPIYDNHTLDYDQTDIICYDKNI